MRPLEPLLGVHAGDTVAASAATPAPSPPNSATLLSSAESERDTTSFLGTLRSQSMPYARDVCDSKLCVTVRLHRPNESVVDEEAPGSGSPLSTLSLMVPAPCAPPGCDARRTRHPPCMHAAASSDDTVPVCSAYSGGVGSQLRRHTPPPQAASASGRCMILSSHSRTVLS